MEFDIGVPRNGRKGNNHQRGGISFLWFHSSTSNETKDESGLVEGCDFACESSNNRCIGKVTGNGGYTTLHPVDNEEFIEMLNWACKPICKIKIPGVLIGAKNKMEDFIESASTHIPSSGIKN